MYKTSVSVKLGLESKAAFRTANHPFNKVLVMTENTPNYWEITGRSVWLAFHCHFSRYLKLTP